MLLESWKGPFQEASRKPNHGTRYLLDPGSCWRHLKSGFLAIQEVLEALVIFRKFCVLQMAYVKLI